MPAAVGPSHRNPFRSNEQWRVAIDAFQVLVAVDALLVDVGVGVEQQFGQFDKIVPSRKIQRTVLPVVFRQKSTHKVAIFSQSGDNSLDVIGVNGVFKILKETRKSN